MLQFYKCFFGQMLSILIAIAVISQDTLTQKHAKYSFFVLYAPVYIVIFTVSQIYILIHKPQPTKKIHFYRFFICGCLDFLGGYFLNKSFAQTSPCLIVFLTQMIYPLSAFTELFIFTKAEHKKKYQKLLKKLSKKLLIFAVLSCACFIVNYKQEGSSFRFSYSGILYVILSDIFYMSNTFCQSCIVPHTGAYLYLRNFSFSGFVYCIAICVADIKSFDMSFYRTYYTYLIFYTLSLSLFYIFASPYINKFGGIVFNSSVITGSVYCGIYKMISTEMNFAFLFCHLLCIMVDLVIVYLEKIK